MRFRQNKTINYGIRENVKLTSNYIHWIYSFVRKNLYYKDLIVMNSSFVVISYDTMKTRKAF
jgi:hypothetical protein